MGDLPYPISANTLEELKSQLFEIIRKLYEEKIGGCDLGDVFSIVGNVLTLALATSSGLTKEGNLLAVDITSDGGLTISSSGMYIKLLSTGGLETTAAGLGVKLDGTSLTKSASGLKLTDPLSLGNVTLNNDGLHLLDTNASHDLIVSPGSDLTADRTLLIVTGDTSRTITLTGNPTLSDWFDQAVKQASSPTFAGLTKVGSASHYTTIESDGTIVFAGDATVWDDLNFDPARSGGPVATRPDDVTINSCIYKEFTSANNQLCGDSQEVPHKAKLSTNLYGHLHCFLKGGESAGTTGVTFTIYWSLRQSTGLTTGSFTLSATSAELTANPVKFDIFHGAGFTGPTELGAQLALGLYRTAGDAGDVVVTTYGVHYEIDMCGSHAITTK